MNNKHGNCEGNFKDLQNAVKNGAKLEKNEFWNRVEYAIQYPQGGWHRITKRNYEKLTLTNH